MLKDISINLAAPLCVCGKENINWGLKITKEKDVSLFIKCKKCGERVSVPYNKLTANIQIGQ